MRNTRKATRAKLRRRNIRMRRTCRKIESEGGSCTPCIVSELYTKLKYRR